MSVQFLYFETASCSFTLKKQQIFNLPSPLNNHKYPKRRSSVTCDYLKFIFYCYGHYIVLFEYPYELLKERFLGNTRSTEVSLF